MRADASDCWHLPAINNMTLKELQKELVKTHRLFEKKYKMKASGKYTALKVMEELGEFIKVMLVCENEVTDLKKKKYDGKNIKDEMGEELADVFGWLIYLADIYNIDFEKELKKKWCNVKKACLNLI